MITHFNVEGLFNLYNYDLDFANADGTPIKFITGPNGYGKSTILFLLNALYAQKFELILDVPFQSLSIDFDGVSLSVKKEIQYTQLYEDERIPDIEQLTFIFCPSAGSEEETFTVTRKNKTISVSEAPVFGLFMQSRTSYFITDQRLVHKKTDVQDMTSEMDLSAVEDNASHLKSAIAEKKFNPVVSLNRGVEEMSEKTYNEKREFLAKRINTLKKYGLISDMDFSVIPYSSDYNHIFPGYFRGITESLDAVKPFEEKLSLFETIIESCDFANKKIQIGPNWGYRFKVDDKDGSPLPLSRLSSGEKQMLIQVYEMLFRAQKGTLVLIDEPEISFHMLWQVNYLANLRKIVEMNGIQLIVATHSPEIFGGQWSMVQDLYEQAR